MSPDAMPPKADGRPPLALLIEPDADTREMYAFALEQDHWDVAQAQTGREGLERALGMRPDVVVSELCLPELDGYDLCRRLRGEPATQQTPIVIVTASAFPADVKRASEAGSNAVLCKPCSPADLVNFMRALLAERRGPLKLLGGPFVALIALAWLALPLC